MEMMTDEAVLEKHHPAVRPRCRMELIIVNQIIADIAKSGMTAKVADYDDEPTPDLKAALFNLDDAHLELYEDKECKDYVGTIFLVFGNSGWDLISDYSVSLGEFLKPAMEVARKLENGLL